MIRTLALGLAVATSFFAANATLYVDIEPTGYVNYIDSASDQVYWLRGPEPVGSLNAASNNHHNKTKKGHVKNNPLVKNFNCNFCKKQLKSAVQCGAANFANPTPCTQLVQDLATFCHGFLTFTGIQDNLYAYGFSTFAGCHEGPLIAYAKVSNSATLKDVKYLTCKHCNTVFKQYSKCVVGQNANPITGPADAMANCLQDGGVLAQENQLCEPSAFWAWTIDGATNKILAVTGEPVLAGQFVCSAAAGAYIRKVNSDTPSTYAARYAGMTSLGHIVF